jgi:hypothetical protein
VRSFLFHDPSSLQKPYSVTATVANHVRNCGLAHWLGPMIVHYNRGDHPCYAFQLRTATYCCRLLCVAVGPGTTTHPNVQGCATLESGMLKNRLGPSDGRSFRVKWDCFGLYSDTLFENLADRDKNVSINHFEDGSSLPPVRGFLHPCDASWHEAAIFTCADVCTVLLRAVHAATWCNLSRAANVVCFTMALRFQEPHSTGVSGFDARIVITPV